MRNHPKKLLPPLWIILPLLFGLGLILFYPFRFVFEFDSDEGINLIKALLQYRGYSLYSDIYNDQPPLFTFFLTFLFQLAEPSVTLARIGVVGFSMVLLGSALHFLQRTWGSAHAFSGFLLIILLPYYPRLSVSVMIGLPAVALSLAAFAFYVRWKRSRDGLPLTASAVLMAMAVLTKGFVAPLGFLMGLSILQSELSKSGKRTSLLSSLRATLLWGGIVGGILLIAALMIGPDHWNQLSSSHSAAGEVQEYIERAQKINIHLYLRDAWGVLALGIIGAGLAAKRRELSTVILALWSFAGYLLLANTLPVWYHHQLVITVPAAILASIPLGETISRLWRQIADRRIGLPSVAFALALAFMVWTQFSRIPPLLRHFDFGFPNLWQEGEKLSRPYTILHRMTQERNESEMLVTDRLMFAFRLEKTVPPDLAVFSGKRLHTGLLTEQMVISAIAQTDPDQVLLARHEMPLVKDYLKGRYELVYWGRPYHLYLRATE
jgi:hypothetical protein